MLTTDWVNYSGPIIAVVQVMPKNMRYAMVLGCATRDYMLAGLNHRRQVTIVTPTPIGRGYGLYITTLRQQFA
jgi:hypothetical protein